MDLEGQLTLDVSNFRWVKTRAPKASSRTDDIWFLDENVGWAVNSNAQILKTTDGFETFDVQAQFKGNNYLRCVGFANANVGWVGAIDREQENERLFHTIDGGKTWKRVENLPPGAPGRICGLSVVDANTVFASGTNYPDEPSAVVKTVDGGKTWTAIDLQKHAAILVDILFTTPTEGWVVGGEDVVKHPARQPERDDVIPVVLHTTDGGATWQNVVEPIRKHFPRGEWGWKIQLVEGTVFVALENFRDGAILRSDDGGETWRRVPINDRQRNGNLEGIGFIDKQRGWVGGWGTRDMTGGYTSATADGGATWDDANELGFRINRFRFIGNPLRVGYASGDTVYKFTDRADGQPVAAAAEADGGARTLSGRNSLEIPFEVPSTARDVRVDVWERFGRKLRSLVAEQKPAAGPRTVTWDFRDAAGEVVEVGPYLIRISVNDAMESLLAYREA